MYLEIMKSELQITAIKQKQPVKITKCKIRNYNRKT